MPGFRPPGDCPNCGESVPIRAQACPGCGATEEAGWNEATRYDGLDLPDEAFSDRWDPPRRTRQPGLAWGWVWVAVALLAALTAWIWLP